MTRSNGAGGPPPEWGNAPLPQTDDATLHPAYRPSFAQRAPQAPMPGARDGHGLPPHQVNQGHAPHQPPAFAPHQVAADHRTQPSWPDAHAGQHPNPQFGSWSDAPAVPHADQFGAATGYHHPHGTEFTARADAASVGHAPPHLSQHHVPSQPVPELRGAAYDHGPYDQTGYQPTPMQVPSGYPQSGFRTAESRPPEIGQQGYAQPTSYDPRQTYPESGYADPAYADPNYPGSAYPRDGVAQPAFEPGFGDGHQYANGHGAAPYAAAYPAEPGAPGSANPYDLSRYGYGGDVQAPASDPQYADWAPQQAGTAQGMAAYPAADGNYPARAPQPYGYDSHGQPLHAPGGMPTAAAGSHAGHPDDEEHYDDDEYDDEDEPPRSKRRVLVIASLIGAIAMGGGLAFGYKTMFTGNGNGAAPVVRADKRPVRSEPDQPGGKEFANTNSKLLNRLDASNPAATRERLPQSSAGSDGNRIKVVPTVVVGRDGNVIAPPPTSAETVTSTPLPGSTVMLPGTSVDGFNVQRPAAAPPASEPVVVASAPPARPVRGNGPPLPSRAPSEAAEPVAAAPRFAPQPSQPRRVAAVTPAAPAARAAPSQSIGYVAVLSSSGNQMEALKSFADLQQKYPSVLQSHTPEVREADLSARGLGKMYRAVVGPPGSRQAAMSLCQKLKAAGHTGCWVSSY